MTSVKYDLPERVESDLIRLAKKYDVSKVTLFGSRARGNNNAKSDIDIAVHGCSDFANFSLDAEEDIWSLLKFDIVNMDDSVSDELKNEIQRDGVTIYEKI